MRYLGGAAAGLVVVLVGLAGFAATGPGPATEAKAEPRIVPAPASTPGVVAPASGAAPRPSASSGTSVGSRRYDVPAEAIIVSPAGDDDAPGTAEAPVRTVGRAVALAPSGTAVVLRAGTYHESVTVHSDRQLTIQPWPGEEVWFDGSVPIDDWTSEGEIWHAGWTTEFDSSPTYTRGAEDNVEDGWRFLDPARPLAAHPDQVWIGAAAMRQVGSVAEVTDGTFFHDTAADRLYLGSDPTSGEVRVAALGRAIWLRGDGSVLRGVGIRRYAPSVPDIGAVTVEGRGVTVEDVAILDSSTIGIGVVVDGVTLRNLHVAGSGMLGIHASYADGLLIDGVLAEDNNVEGFNTAPVSGGAKVGRSRDVVVRGSVFRTNHGPGLWIDESVSGVHVIGNELRDNDRHGASIEISHDAVFADNVVVGNGASGVKINNTSHVRVWNNTFADNQRSVWVVQDERRHGPNASGRDPRYPDDPSMSWIVGPVEIHNNVIAASGASECLLCATGQVHGDELGITTDNNIYRQLPSGPLILYAAGGFHDVRYDTLEAFTGASGQEASSVLATGTEIADPADDRGDAEPVAPSVARPLPADIAGIIGRDAGLRHIGAW